MLLHFGGADASTSIAESGVGATSKTFINNATIVVAQSKFGGTSLLCPPGKFLTVQASPDFAFQNGDWTVEFWARINDVYAANLIAWYADSDNLFAIERVHTTAGKCRFRARWRRDGVDLFSLVPTVDEDVLDTWVAFAVERSGNTVRFYVDGVVRQSAAVAAAQVFNAHDWDLLIGTAPIAGTVGLRAGDAYFDEFRISHAAFYSGAYTPAGDDFSPPIEVAALGQFNLLQAWAAAEHAQFDIVRAAFENAAHGQFPLNAAHENAAHGHTIIIDSIYETAAHGQFAINMVHVESAVVGTFDIADSFENGVRGNFNVYDTPRENAAHGLHDVRASFDNAAHGKHDIVDSYESAAHGKHNIENTSGALYALYESDTSYEAIDLDGVPLETFSSLPATTTATVTGEGVHYFKLAKRNFLGLMTVLKAWRVELDASNNEVALIPTSPSRTTIRAAVAAKVIIIADYQRLRDVLPADRWAIYVTTDGSTPDPDVDSPTTVAFDKANAVERLTWTSPAYTDGLTIKAIVRVERTSDSRESGNTNVVTTTANDTAPAAPVGRKVQRQRGERVFV